MEKVEDHKIQYEKLPILEKINAKLKLGGLPLTVDNIRYGAENMIRPGRYKKLDSMLAHEKREKILDVQR